jgi:inositol hexakisphosphate/diphosphoinositol-pentakisphosphate kinase
MWLSGKYSRKYYDDCAQILTEHMLAARKPKSKVSFSALAPLLATMEDPVDFWGNKKKKHRRGPSIADRVKMMLMGEGSSAEVGNDDGVMDEENDKLSDLHGSDDLCNGNVVEGSENFSTHPVRNLPDQLATEPASSASITRSGNSSLADADDVSSLNGKDNGVAMVPTTHQEELRCVITIIRHGDRTPKQKLKGDINGDHFLRYYHDHSKGKVKKDLKVKAKKEMVYVIDGFHPDSLFQCFFQTLLLLFFF